MFASHLNLVDQATTESGDVPAPDAGAESRAERVRRMQADVRALAREQIAAMTEAMIEAARLAEEVATGGDAYPVGVRELASRIKNELEVQAKSVEVLLQRL